MEKKLGVLFAELACGNGAPRNEKDAKRKHRHDRGQYPRRVRREHQQRDGTPAEPAQAGRPAAARNPPPSLSILEQSRGERATHGLTGPTRGESRAGHDERVDQEEDERNNVEAGLVVVDTQART